MFIRNFVRSACETTFYQIKIPSQALYTIFLANNPKQLTLLCIESVPLDALDPLFGYDKLRLRNQDGV